MGNEERDLLYRIAGDVGFVRAQVEVLMEAKLPDRMTFVEGQQKVQNGRIHLIESKREKFVAKTLLFASTMAALVGAAAAITHTFI